jgi:U6 snRNA-associated Sm-like protein LSm6
MLPGDLQSVDGYMNIALERCKEFAEGRVIRNWGDAFVRGNNGLLPAMLLCDDSSDSTCLVTYICADNA